MTLLATDFGPAWSPADVQDPGANAFNISDVIEFDEYFDANFFNIDVKDD